MSLYGGSVSLLFQQEDKKLEKRRLIVIQDTMYHSVNIYSTVQKRYITDKEEEREREPSECISIVSFKHV